MCGGRRRLLGETTSCVGADGKLVCSYDYLCNDIGQQECEWVVENYERLGFDFSDMSKVGFMTVTATDFSELVIRHEGAVAAWREAFPDFPEANMFIADCAQDSGSPMEAGYNGRPRSSPCTRDRPVCYIAIQKILLRARAERSRTSTSTTNAARERRRLKRHPEWTTA